MSEYNREWIIKNGITVLEDYFDEITVRQLYYRLVAIGMTNDLKHYKKVVAAMTDARWKGKVRFSAFIDRERSMCGNTDADPVELEQKIDQGKEQIGAWMRSYNLNRWENQPKYIEVWIEKKALQGVFEQPCYIHGVGLAPCKGYPSLTFLHDAKDRFNDAIDRDQKPTILYFGDYDPSGEDIPRSLKKNLARMGCEIELHQIALNQQQITEMDLPSVPAKSTDVRTKNWNGKGAVELDAIEPHALAKMVEDALSDHFDTDLHDSLMEREEGERAAYRTALKTFVEAL